jgi:hypothetical protein
MLVQAHFNEGKCDLIVFSRIEQGEIKELSENERDLLLKANGSGKEWERLGKNGVTAIFETKGGEFRAQHDVVEHTLSIFTREAMKRRQDARKAEEEKKLKGF